MGSLMATRHKKFKIPTTENSQIITINQVTPNPLLLEEVCNTGLSLKEGNRLNKQIRWIFKNNFNNFRNNRSISRLLKTCKWKISCKEQLRTLSEAMDNLIIKYNMKTWRRNCYRNTKRSKRRVLNTNQLSHQTRKWSNKLWKILQMLLVKATKAWNLIMVEIHKTLKVMVIIWTIQQHLLIWMFISQHSLSTIAINQAKMEKIQLIHNSSQMVKKQAPKQMLSKASLNPTSTTHRIFPSAQQALA